MDFSVLFCLYLLYVMISYLYSSIVEISCHFLFHGCGLLAEMPYTFVLFQNKCLKEKTDSTSEQVDQLLVSSCVRFL